MYLITAPWKCRSLEGMCNRGWAEVILPTLCPTFVGKNKHLPWEERSCQEEGQGTKNDEIFISVQQVGCEKKMDGDLMKWNWLLEKEREGEGEKEEATKIMSNGGFKKEEIKLIYCTKPTLLQLHKWVDRQFQLLKHRFMTPEIKGYRGNVEIQFSKGNSSKSVLHCSYSLSSFSAYISSLYQ